MAFKYLGKLESLGKEVAEAQEAINARYREILGEEQYRKLEDASRRLLTPSSFFDNVHDVKSRLGGILPEDTSNKMILATIADTTVNESGVIKVPKIRTAPAFYISDKGFENSGTAGFTEKPIASYVHEFDHFVWYALQRVPLYLAQGFISDKAKPKNTTMSVPEFMIQLMQEYPLANEEALDRLIIYSFANSIREIFEKSNRILDKQVLSSIGVDVPLSWRDQPREYQYVPTQIGMLGLPIGGDPFTDLDDQEVIRRAINWPDHLNPFAHREYSDNVLKSIQSVKVTRLPLDEIIKLAGRKGK